MKDTLGIEKLIAFSQAKETPLIVIDLAQIKDNYQELTTLFPQASIYYAVKANPAVEILSLLDSQKSNFDVASRYELDQLLALGVEGSRISFGNTIKKATDIAYFYEKGVRLFASDSEQDIRNLAEHAPNSKIYVRLLPEESSSADWPLSRKFGCSTEMAFDLIVLAQKLGLEPFGLSFHVGSQQRDIEQWGNAISRCAALAKELKETKQIEIRMLNMGGGFPATYKLPNAPLEEYASKINFYLEREFGDDHLQIIIEPGRSLAADSGTLVTQVILVSKKSTGGTPRWVYVDAGLFNGMIETLDESIKYRIVSEKTGPTDNVILAGPTCDSMDVMYEKEKVELPLDLKQGDRLYIRSAGAYTASYASVAFNGFPPIQTFFLQ
ncbi:diaminopimelate decarboxylase [Sphaerochaeta pleomorpha str. Grapes]|uniref:Diaminopimelate decarboxylase n=1 Tax=Sphaerochaeta pleomorpha (strain ATCC BAA-1885 / DSM 22778 / Grapes) TaxID=158190 RepID=G8QS89_SPHPG|nr:type III PLP-dependent enzyme [Sphaerochaeta pleomorpha]AEV28950.1 diaminopimelate decarboxylase [Sphaerochaeta pleomorpha str. Grapes]